MINYLCQSLAWATLQVTVFGTCVLIVVGGLRHLGVTIGSRIAACAIGLTLLLTGLAFVPTSWITSHAISSESGPKTTQISDQSKTPLLPTDDMLKQLLKGDQPSAEPPLKTITEATKAPNAGTGTSSLVANLPTLWQSMEASVRSIAPWLAGLVAMGGLLGISQLLFGVYSLKRLRANSTPVTDQQLREAVDVLCAELSCRVPIEIRESSQLDSAATMGRSPATLLIPATWSEWSEQERRAVLAHEIAHIASDDFRTWFGAKLCSVIHFLNPVMQQLTRVLHFEQELQADHTAAQLCGGRQAYVNVLAKLALAQQHPRHFLPIALAAQSFLPSQGMFMRRIEMLRLKPWLGTTSSRLSRLMLVVLMLGIGWSLIGLRGQPASLQAATNGVGSNADTALPAQGTADSFELQKWIPAETVALVTGRADKILAMPEIKKLLPPKGDSPLEAFGMKLEPLTRITVMTLDPQLRRNESMVVIVESSEPIDPASMFKGQEKEPVEFGTYRGVQANHATALLLNPKTLLFCHQSMVTPFLQGKRASNFGPYASLFSADAPCFLINAEPIRVIMRQVPKGPVEESLTPLWESAQFIGGTLDLSGDAKLNLFGDYANPQSATEAEKTCQAAMVLAKNGISRMPNNEGLNATVAKLVSNMLDSAKSSVQGNRLSITMSMGKTSDLLSNSLLQAVFASRQAASRASSQNNLKQIALAMHNYAAAYQHFPAARSIPSNAKYPVSWRVLILPFIEQNQLYEQYKFDEPWDGPNNSKLLSKMPSVYRHPSASGPNTCYVLFDGPGALFNSDQGPRFETITDGTSLTIMAVEAKTQIPWTKPEDLPFDASKEFAAGFPEIASFGGTGFSAAFADGSVHYFERTLDPTRFKAMVTKAGGEVVQP